MTAKPLVLIVDDHFDNINVLAEALGDDFETSFSTSGASALELIEAQRPDLILLDIMMPGMSGFEVFDHLKASPKNRTIPVIFVTAMNDIDSETKALNAGAADFIHKPINPSVARCRVRNHLELAQYRQQLEALVEARSRSLAEALDRAESADRAKSTFLANMSHELRTPLHQVIGLASLLARKATDETSHRWLSNITTSSQHLLGLLEGLLNIAELEAKTLRLDNHDFELVSALQPVITRATERAEAKGLGLHFVATNATSTVLNGDPGVLKKILEQLLGNAIKFSQRGNVRFALSANPGSFGKISLRFEIKDEGIGMTTATKEGLFQLFNQGDNSPSRKFGGTGSGLSLCKRLVELLNGQMDFDSQPGEGSLFWVSLEFPVGNAARAEQDAAHPDERKLLGEMATHLATESADTLIFFDDHAAQIKRALGTDFEAFESAIYGFEYPYALQILRKIDA